LLVGLFALFIFIRILAYLPTIWAVAVSGDSTQHSLWTQFTFLGGNATMAAWQCETERGAVEPTNRRVGGTCADVRRRCGCHCVGHLVMRV
jgi:hypothetical protein